MIRSNILAAAMLLAAATMSAAGLRSMVIETKDGNGMTVNLSSELVTRFSDGDMILKGDYVDVTVPLSTVKGWIYSDSVVDKVETAVEDNLELTDNGDRITLTGLADASDVSLYSLAGQLIRRDRVSGEYTLGLSELANGVYVLSVNNQSFKIAVNR